MLVGFLHPGAMGAALAASTSRATAWLPDGRSAATRERAAAAGMTEAASLADLAKSTDVIVSVCPPDAAEEVAAQVAGVGFGGTYVDVNAVAPATARRIGGRFARFVDGGIIGPPVQGPGSTRLYLAGADATAVAEIWDGSALEVRIVEGAPGAASAVKACFAAWTKGTAALLLAIRALADAEGVDDALLDEWATSLPDLGARSEATAAGNAPKAWRFAGEMQEAAAAFAAHGLPRGFSDAAADTYGRMAGLKDAGEVDLPEVVRRLLDPG